MEVVKVLVCGWVF